VRTAAVPVSDTASSATFSIMCSSFHSSVGAGVCWVLQLPVPANMRTTTGAHIRPVSLDVGVRLAVAVRGEVLLATVRATPLLAGEHGHVGVVLDPWPQPVVERFGRPDVTLVVPLDAALSLFVTIDRCPCDLRVVLVGLGFHPEPLAKRVERVAFEGVLGTCDLQRVHGLPGFRRCPPP